MQSTALSDYPSKKRSGRPARTLDRGMEPSEGPATLSSASYGQFITSWVPLRSAAHLATLLLRPSRRRDKSHHDTRPNDLDVSAAVSRAWTRSWPGRRRAQSFPQGLEPVWSRVHQPIHWSTRDVDLRTAPVAKRTIIIAHCLYWLSAITIRR
jgi:hypothetical protein